MSHLASLLPGKCAPNAQHVQELFHEYEQGTTREAILVKDVDKYEMLVQAVEYERDAVNLGEALDGLKDLTTFFQVRKVLTTEVVKGWAEEVMNEREKMWKDVSNAP